MIIYGAGLSGCLAGALNRSAHIFEANEEANHFGQHKAVLRFREQDIAHATGIPFRKVRVRKSIFYCNNEYDRVTPRLANMYSRKVSGKIAERSITNLDTVERFIGPPDLHQRLGEYGLLFLFADAPVAAVQVDHDRRAFIAGVIDVERLARRIAVGDVEFAFQAFARRLRQPAAQRVLLLDIGGPRTRVVLTFDVVLPVTPRHASTC